MIVKIDNAYEDGHECSKTIALPDMPGRFSEEDEWWEEVAFPHTGCDHEGNAVYTATVIYGPLAGQCREWN